MILPLFLVHCYKSALYRWLNLPAGVKYCKLNIHNEFFKCVWTSGLFAVVVVKNKLHFIAGSSQLRVYLLCSLRLDILISSHLHCPTSNHGLLWIFFPNLGRTMSPLLMHNFTSIMLLWRSLTCYLSRSVGLVSDRSAVAEKGDGPRFVS